MTISLLQRIAGEQLPIRIEGSEGVDSVQILALAGHVIAEVSAPVHTSSGWVSQSAIVREITQLGQHMLRVSSLNPLVTRDQRGRPRSPLVIGLVTAAFATAGVGMELLRRVLS